MFRRFAVVSCIASVAALSLACGGSDSQNPASPAVAGITPSVAAAVTLVEPQPLGAGGSTLKVSAPTPNSPVDNVTTAGRRPALTVTGATGDFVNASDLDYRFQIFDALGTLVPGMDILSSRSASATPGADLAEAASFMWRARAELGQYFGPWSATATFRTPLPPPPTISCEAGVTLASPDGQPVGYTVVPPTPQSGLAPVTVVCNPPAGSLFPVGTTTVSCTATDAAAREATCSFNVVVTPPVVQPGGGGDPWAGPRAPDPLPGQRLGLPNRFAVVQAVAAQNPGDVAASCQDHGGNWNFMDKLVQTLRLEDSRWCFNAKRGNLGDPSHDVVFYHWGAGQTQGSTQGYIVDVLGGHCGASPNPAWIDQTTITFNAGTTGGCIYPRPGMANVPLPPSNAVPLPDRSQVVRDVAAQFPALLRGSCQTAGGNWDFMDKVVDTLRREDPRWGYNGKLGNVNNPAGDELAYHYGSDTRQGSPNVYLIDVIESHCGTPRAGWRVFSDQAGAWTSRGRF